MRHLRVWFAPRSRALLLAPWQGGTKQRTCPLERPGKIIAALVQGVSWRTEGTRAGLGHSKRNGRVYFLLLLFGGSEKNPTVLSWGSPNRILNVVFVLRLLTPLTSHTFFYFTLF